MKKVIFIFIFFLYACSSSPKEETVSMEDIMPSSERYKEGDYPRKKKEKEVSFYDTLQPFYKILLDSLMIPKQKISLLTKLLG
jgi:hypothetical protein